jgi:hypothetical protein
MACTRSANVSGLGSDLDIALAKLTSPALAEQGLPVYMYVALLHSCPKKPLFTIGLPGMAPRSPLWSPPSTSR